MRRRGLLAQPFVQLGKADQGEQVGLVDGEGLLERRPLAVGIAELAAGRRQVDPQRQLAGIALAGDFEMPRGRGCVGPRQRVDAQPIAGRGLLIVDRQHGFEMAPRLVARARSKRVLRLGQMLIDGGRGHAQCEAQRAKGVKRR